MSVSHEFLIRHERRWRRFYIRTPDLLAAIACIRNGADSIYRLAGLPADAVIDESVDCDYSRRALRFLVGSRQFERVEDGMEIPVDPDIRIERLQVLPRCDCAGGFPADWNLQITAIADEAPNDLHIDSVAQPAESWRDRPPLL